MQKQTLDAVHEAAGKLETASEELKRELEELNEELTEEYITHNGACLCLLHMASHALRDVEARCDAFKNRTGGGCCKWINWKGA